MKRKSWVPFILCGLILFQLIDIQAQKIEKKIQISWKDNISNTISEDLTREFLFFENASFLQNHPSLPCYFERIAIDRFYEDYQIHVSNAVYESLDPNDYRLIPENFNQTSLEIHLVSASWRGRPYALLSFVPIVKNGENSYSRLTSVTITFEGGAVKKDTKAGKSYTNRSVLASGQWGKVSLNKTGIYKITYKDLVQLGFSAPISSAQIALFGNSGRMLPELNSTPRIDDLRELPIRIFDGGDGKIDDGDYFIFYGESPHTTQYDVNRKKFTHTINIYCDSSYYFVTATPGIGEKKRVQIVDNSSLQSTQSVDDYTYYDFYEEDKNNLGKTGRDWFGDIFDVTTERTVSFNVPGFKSESSRLGCSFANISQTASNFKVQVNHNPIGTVGQTSINAGTIATINKADLFFTPTSSTLNVTLTYSKPTAASSAYLDWLEIEVPCSLTMHSSQFAFCNPSTVAENSVTRFNISNATAETFIWDVTDPGEMVQLALQKDGNDYSFKSNTDILRQFYAFDGKSFLNVTPCGHVSNQNLHGTGAVDLVIVTHPDFLTQANKLASSRRTNDGLSVMVATTDQVYNEFSSGSLDVMAIRDYMKMIYDKTDHQYPKYLLLFGRPSYDFRGRDEGTEIFVPNYQYYTHSGAISEYDFYSNDDNLGLLDDTEGGDDDGLYDISIGRFPASTAAQANTAVEKSIIYTARKDLVPEGTSKVSNLGSWRNMMAFVADDEDYNDFINNADKFTKIVAEQTDNINFDKIYLDAFLQVSNAGGQRYPEVNEAINNRMNLGCLFFTYIGHSGKDGWSTERVLENSDINNWTNKYNLPVMLTLSCTFGYYDRPALSPAELAFFNNNGGAAALITTSREAWSAPNNTFGRHIFNNIFKKDAGRYPTIGEINQNSKNDYGGSSASLAMFVLMGDPSMPIALPIYNIVTDSINHHAVSSQTDTIRALSKVTISGHLTDDQNQTLSNFNGSIFPVVYDKKVTATTLSNDPRSPAFDFDVQKSILFKGNCSVKDGYFNFTFFVPKDIDYDYGNGKISYYAHNNLTDGSGAFTDFIIGGTDTTGIQDNEGPQIELFLNDENFVNGGIVNENPMLIAKVKDNYGINTTGNGIGHDLTGILDNATESPIILNDYYETERDSFNMGTVRYNLSNLSVGKHSIMVRAWDINNNHSESELTFEVVSDEKLTLSHVLNYPNPFTTHTEFFFEQNQNGGMFDIQVQIYTISGKLLKTISTSQYIEGNRSIGIPWDGLDDYGDKIGKGVYMYKLRVRNQNNEIAEKIEKLVIL